jgi:UDP-glucose 4-epimerase
MKKKNRVIVFGGSGFLGSAVVKKLLQKKCEVTVFDMTSPSYAGMDSLSYFKGDILNIEEVKSAISGHNIVYNFAGAADLEDSINNPLRYLNLNIIGNANILNSAVEVGAVDRFVYASSAYALSEKGAFYGASKRASEKITQIYHRNFGINYTILRYGSVYGPGADEANRIYRFIKQAVDDGVIIYPGDGLEEREYIHVEDAAELSLTILEDFGENQSFILTGNERFNYCDVLNIIREIMGSSINIKLLGEDYRGHYSLTPYSFDPDVGKKISNNPSIDFGQGILQCIQEYYSTVKR